MVLVIIFFLLLTFWHGYNRDRMILIRLGTLCKQFSDCIFKISTFYICYVYLWPVCFYFNSYIFHWQQGRQWCWFAFFLVHAQVNENCSCNLLFVGLHPDCQTVLVELLVAMVSQRITAEELALLIRLFLEKTPPTVNSNPHQSLSYLMFRLLTLITYAHSVCTFSFSAGTRTYLLDILPVTLSSHL